MRLYKAICAWLEADAAAKNTPPEQYEPHPEGNNFTNTERSYQNDRTELRAGVDRSSIDDDQGGVYRVRPIGFRPNNPVRNANG